MLMFKCLIKFYLKGFFFFVLYVKDVLFLIIWVSYFCGVSSMVESY